MIKFLYTVYQFIRKWFYLKSKVAEAYFLHKLTGRQYHVIPLLETDKLIVVSNQYKKKFNRLAKKYGRAKIDHRELLNKSRYSTPVEGYTRPSLKVK